MGHRSLLKLVAGVSLVTAILLVIFCGYVFFRGSEPLEKQVECVSQRLTRPQRYTIIFNWPEQVGGNLRQLIYFSGVSRYLEARVVLPFVVNKRFVAYPHKASRNLGEYFDIAAMNRSLVQHGYAPLASYKDYRQHCDELDVLVILLRELGHFVSRMGVNASRIREETRARTRANGGVLNGSFLIDYLGENDRRMIGMNVKHILLFDENLPELETYFKTLILQGNEAIRSIGFASWMCKGDFLKGQLQIHLPKDIDKFLYPSDFPRHPSLYAASDRYIAQEFGGKPYISIHLRIEFHLRGATYEVGKGNDVKGTSRFIKLTACLDSLRARLEELRSAVPGIMTYVAIDICSGGSDTTDAFIGRELGDQACKNVSESLGERKTFNMSLLDEEIRKDSGKASMVEAEIVSRAQHLLLFGGGQYQRYFISYPFLGRHLWDLRKMDNFCDLNYSKTYFTKVIEEMKKYQ